ncbi:hypothetical protein TNCV_4368241 [Trichonephila clavipes]|nr:hypothetical protein TNCV_4368241 [Trichonephila clavipes]
MWNCMKVHAERCRGPRFSSVCPFFTDEASFIRESVFNAHNLHMRASNNPHGTRNPAAQHYFSENVWAGIIGDCMLGSYLLLQRLDMPETPKFSRDSYRLFRALLHISAKICGFNMTGFSPKHSC